FRFPALPTSFTTPQPPRATSGKRFRRGWSSEGERADKCGYAIADLVHLEPGGQQLERLASVSSALPCNGLCCVDRQEVEAWRTRWIAGLPWHGRTRNWGHRLKWPSSSGAVNRGSGV